VTAAAKRNLCLATAVIALAFAAYNHFVVYPALQTGTWAQAVEATMASGGGAVPPLPAAPSTTSFRLTRVALPLVAALLAGGFAMHLSRKP
jgi:hypothetical protein